MSEDELMADLMKKFRKLLRRIVAANPDADEARLKRLFVDAVEADPILGEAAMLEGFWDAFGMRRRR